nr:MAG TPA: hypothetical protein [Bacteriophage sp.]
MPWIFGSRAGHSIRLSYLLFTTDNSRIKNWCREPDSN